MAAAKAEARPRRYRDYDWIVLAHTVKCPRRGVSADNFPSNLFAFFIEDGFFCIEDRRSGDIVETAPTNVREARRKTEKQLEAEHDARIEAKMAGDATA